MQTEAWATATATVVTIGTVVGGYWATHTQGKRIEGKADIAASKAESAEANTAQVSNGFAHKTISGIESLLEGQARLEIAMNLLFEAHGRTVKRLDHTNKKIDKHIEESRQHWWKR